MRIGINFTDLIPGKIGGMENYMRSVLYYLPLVNSENAYVIFTHKEIEDTLPKDGYEIVFIDNYERDSLSIELRQKVVLHNIDVWWSPLLILDPLDLNIPSAFSIPDMQHEYYPEFFSKEVLDWRKKYFQLSALAADAIFTISENSKSDICKYLNVKPDKVVVTYLGVAPWFDQELVETKRSEIKLKYNLPEKYVFFPANTWPHKNHKNLLEAFRLVRKKHPDITLLLTGYESDAHKEILKQIKKYKLSKDVKFLGYIGKSEMPYIYKNAICLVFPSLFEGFGIPIVEAMKSGCPVICSNNTSVPEVAGEACLYVDPKKSDDIAEKIINLVNDGQLKIKLSQKGAGQAQKFSYEECAKKTLKELERLYENKKSVSEDKPLVSIITPSYNQGEFIKRTIDSVLNQDYPNIEYILIDGGSKDNTVDIVKSYGGKIKWVSQKDHGQTDAINKGLRIAKGEIVAWLNSDDTYEPGCVSKIVNFFQKNPDAKFVHGNGNHIDVDDKFIERYPSEQCSFERLHASCPVCQPTTFWRKSIMDDVGYLNENWNYGMDYDYWIRISKKHKIYFIEDHLANTRVYLNTKTFGESDKVHKELLKIVASHYETVSSSWIYAYAHAKLKKCKRGTKWSEFTFRMKIIFITLPLFFKYNGKISKGDIKMLWGWLKGGLFSLLSNYGNRN